MKPKMSIRKLVNRRAAKLSDMLPGNREVVERATRFVDEIGGVSIAQMLGMEMSSPVPFCRQVVTGIIAKYAGTVSHPTMAVLFGGNQSTYSRAETTFMGRSNAQELLDEFDRFDADDPAAVE